MLKLFRQRKAVIRALLFVIVGLVGFMMVVTLVPGLGQTDRSLRDPQGMIASVGDLTLTQLEVQREYRRRVEQLGGDSPAFRKLILEGLVDDLIIQRAATYEAERLGLRATGEEVRLQLRQIGIFYPDGRFVGTEAYRQILQREFGLNEFQFEEEVRRQILLTKLFFWVTAGVTVSPAEIEQEYRLRTERARIEFVVFRPEDLTRALAPAEDELRGFYERNRERYQVAERRAVRYLAIDFEELNRRLAVTRQELEDYYQRQRENYRLPESVRARHILFLSTAPATVGETGSRAENPARQQAEEVFAQLRRGADFAALARKYSAHAESRDQGGDLGWIQRGQTVPALDEVLFSRPPGSPPELIETGYGVHIVQVLEHHPERLRPLAEVRGEIEPGLKRQKVENEGLALARRSADAVRAGKAFEAAAREAGGSLRDSPLFARTERLAAFGASTEFQEAAFGLPAASAGQPNAPVSAPVALPSGYVILQLKEVSPAHQAPFEEVRTGVAGAYRQEQAAELAREAAAKFATEAKAKNDLRAAARAAGLEVKTSEEFGRLGVVAGLGSVRELAPVAFSLPVGALSQPVRSGSHWVVLRVLARPQVDTANIPPEQREGLASYLREQKRGLAWGLFTASIKKRLTAEGKLKLNDAAIKRLVGEA